MRLTMNDYQLGSPVQCCFSIGRILVELVRLSSSVILVDANRRKI